MRLISRFFLSVLGGLWRIVRTTLYIIAVAVTFIAIVFGGNTLLRSSFTMLPKAWADYLATVPGSGTNFASLPITVSAVLAQYQAMVLCDWVAGKTTCASIKPASTAAGASDPAVTTTLSPNSVGLSTPVSNAGSAVASTGANLPAVAYLYGYNGTTWDQLQVDGSKNLKVTQAGSQSNASSGVATSSTNAQSVAWLYGFNGTTWDQLQVDGSKNLKVTIAANTANASSNASSGVATSSTNAQNVVWNYIYNGATWDQWQGTGGAANVRITANTTVSIDPCAATAKSFATISQAASAQVITGTASKKTYICSYMFNGSDAENISIVEGTGTTCATNIFALLGSTTAANGMNFLAGSGAGQGNGQATVLNGSGDANATAANVCILQSGSGRVAGVIGYVQQ